MASLAISYADLRAAIGQFLGFGSASTSWSSGQIALIKIALDDGYRQFLYPVNGYDWTFLHPVASIYAYGTVTGVVASSSSNEGTGLTTIVATESIFYPSMVGATIAAGDATTTITGYVSGTSVTLTGDLVVDFAADAEMTITSGGVFALPADFGTFESRITYPADSHRQSISMVGEYEIRRRQQGSSGSGYPEVAAIRPKAAGGGALQGFELVLYPVPEEPVVLTYQYGVLPQAMDATTNQYPYGADRHGLCLKESCLAAAESNVLHIAGGDHQQLFLQRLAASIAQDEDLVPGNLGFSGSETPERERTVQLHYNGAQI